MTTPSGLTPDGSTPQELAWGDYAAKTEEDWKAEQTASWELSIDPLALVGGFLQSLPTTIVTTALGWLAAALDMVPIIGSTLSDIVDNIAAGLNGTNTTAIDAGTTATGAQNALEGAFQNLADLLDMVPIVGSTLSDFVDNIATGLNEVNTTATTAAETAAAAHDWTSIFTDNFNRSNGAVANGWTVVGSQGQIVSNQYSITGTTNLVASIIRDTTISTGKQRIQGIVKSPNATADCGLVLCSNSAGTQGLIASVYPSSVHISRFSTSLSGAPTVVTLVSNNSLPSAIVDGNVISFSVRNGTAWIEREGVSLLSATNVHAVVPSTNSYAGAYVAWQSFNSSGKWDDITLYS